MKNKEKFLIATGLLLIAAALFLTAYNLYGEVRARCSTMKIMARLETDAFANPSAEASTQSDAAEKSPTTVTEETEIPDYLLDPDMEMPIETINGLDYIGILRIPALDLELPVITEWSYSNLKISPCRYSGSAYQDNLVIAAHNYTAHFGNLKKLHEGDTATFTDMDGNVFTYDMVARETIQPTDIVEMVAGEWDLTLFTCTIGGSNRLTVRFERVENEE